MAFIDRCDAGRQLAALLDSFAGQPGIVYALPRGGVVVAAEVAKRLKYPLDLLLVRKIGHPYHPEYAVGAISESGHLVKSPREAALLTDQAWLDEECKRQLAEIARQRTLYLKGRKSASAKGKIAIIVDDGIATGLTMEAAVAELKSQRPSKLIVAVPVAPADRVRSFEKLADQVVTILAPGNDRFFGAVGAYYKDFAQTEDAEVLALLNTNKTSL
jgi:putative phosphoribosyl transferase